MHQVATYIDDVVPKNQELCCKLNLCFAIQCIEMTSREQRLVTKEQIAIYFFGLTRSILKYFSDKTF